MRRYTITAARGRDNATQFTLQDADGEPVDLDVLGATRVTVEVCGRCSTAVIDADFAGTVVSVKFGMLDLPVGTYYPSMIYYSPASEAGTILAGRGFETELILHLNC